MAYSAPPGTRTSSAMVRRETSSKKHLLSPASLLPQHASRANGLRSTPPEAEPCACRTVSPKRAKPAC